MNRILKAELGKIYQYLKDNPTATKKQIAEYLIALIQKQKPAD